MDNSIDFYWKTVNKMLRNDQIEFNQPISSKANAGVYTLTLRDATHLKDRIQFALKNSREIAILEYEFNDGQPEKTSLKHLQWAKVFIESGRRTVLGENLCNSKVLNAQSYVSIGEFLLECHVAAHQNTSELVIQTDIKRKPLISYIFDDDEFNVETALAPDPPKHVQYECAQLIFESADVPAAIDELLINLSDQTWSQWRITSVYIQESLRSTVLNLLKTQRLNAANNIINEVSFSDEIKRNKEELTKQFGGKYICSDNGTICLLLDVPPKYLPQSTKSTFHQIPIAVNFFRTTKEVIQLTKSSVCSSVWTGEIEIFYELAAELDAKIIWSNSVGMFDKCMPSMNAQLDFKQSISTISTINTKEKYAAHVFVDGSKKIPKYLYISYGKTFAN